MMKLKYLLKSSTLFPKLKGVKKEEEEEAYNEDEGKTIINRFSLNTYSFL